MSERRISDNRGAPLGCVVQPSFRSLSARMSIVSDGPPRNFEHDDARFSQIHIHHSHYILHRLAWGGYGVPRAGRHRIHQRRRGEGARRVPLMAPAAWFVLVPLAHASLLSGIVLSLGTTWGLFRYYWVVLKLGITVFATVILLIYMGTFRQMAGVAADPVLDLAAVRNASPIIHAILALVLLLAATVLGVYKPFGITEYGKRKHEEQRRTVSPSSVDALGAIALDAGSGTPVSIYVAGAVALLLVLLIVILHLTGATPSRY